MEQPTTPNTPTVSEDDDAELFDYALIRQWAGFLVRSVGRHKVAAATAFVLVATLGALVATFIPKKYQVEVKLLANRNQMMEQLGNPHRNNNNFDDPTRAAAEMVKARDSLVNIIKQTNLIKQWDQSRNAVFRFKDEVMQLLGGKWTDDQRMDNMVGTLEQKLYVFTSDNMVVIGIYWPDAQMARTLVEAAQQAFLETRHIREVSAISEAISALEQNASQMQGSIDQAIADVRKAADEARRGVRKEVAAVAAAAPKTKVTAGSETPQAELSQLKFMIKTKRRMISDLEDNRQRRLTELEGELTTQRVVYSANHPVIADIEQKIAALKGDSPQVLQLKRDEAALIEEYKTRGGKDPTSLVEPSSGGGGARSAAADVDMALASVAGDLRDDPSIMVARDQLRMATARYHDALMKVDAARMELEMARAAFKYRYSVVSPAQTPRTHISPNIPLIYLAGIFAAVLFAIFASFLLDTWGGRLVESWQVERKLKLSVLAQLRV